MDISTFRAKLEAQGITQLKLAESLGIKQPAIAGWFARGQIPPERVLAIEAITGIPRHEIRPDIYPPDEAANG